MTNIALSIFGYRCTKQNRWSVFEFSTRLFEFHLGVMLLGEENKTKKNIDPSVHPPLTAMDFAVLANHRMKVMENEKQAKYQDFAREMKMFLNIKVTVSKTPFVDIAPRSTLARRGST